MKRDSFTEQTPHHSVRATRLTVFLWLMLLAGIVISVRLYSPPSELFSRGDLSPQSSSSAHR